MRACSVVLKSSAASSSSANCLSSSATAVFRAMFAEEMDAAEPGMRNSNLLPVKAKGEVRLRSVVSLGKRGSAWTPTLKSSFCLTSQAVSFSIASSMPVSSSPRNMEMIAGGASAAPSLWSLPAEAMEMRSRSW